MPELPEVETVRSQLDRELAGAMILAVDLWRSGREFPSGISFVRGLEGASVQAVKRRAKLLIWELDEGRRWLLAHLKMTGRFLQVSSEYEVQKHDRLRLVYRSPVGEVRRLVWSDMRQFGYLKLVSRSEGEAIVAGYGLEPLEVSVADLAEHLDLSTTRAIKTVLLDQSVVAGIGNIYADEACFLAGIRPTRLASRLTRQERQRLAREIQVVLRASLAQKGTSAHHYIDTAGEKGGFLKLLQVYGRAGKTCMRCSGVVERMTFRGRGTHFCASCQR